MSDDEVSSLSQALEALSQADRALVAAVIYRLSNSKARGSNLQPPSGSRPKGL